MSSHSSGDASSKRETLSKLVDKIFDRYTIVPSSVADEEEINELRTSFENMGACDDTITSDADDQLGTDVGQLENAHPTNRKSVSFDRTVDPREIQLPSGLSGSETANTSTYSRKAIPQTLWETMPQIPDSPSSASTPPFINISDDDDDDIEATASCERCLIQKIECRPNNKGAACSNCREKRRKCSFVPPPKPRPGARGISTPPDGSFDSFNSEAYDITDSNDESFETDSNQVRLQRVFGKVLYLTKTHEDRFAKLECQLNRMENKLDMFFKLASAVDDESGEN